MATIHSGYEAEASNQSSARRYSTHVEHDALEALRKAAASSSEHNNSRYSPIPEEKTTAEVTVQSAYTTQPSTPQPASTCASNIELSTLNPTHDANNPAEPEFSLPPVDGGKDAWLFLFSAFVLEVLVWGNFSHLPFAYLCAKFSTIRC
jgi:hypothetical protein